MGETHSKPLRLGNLSERDVEMIQKKFHFKGSNGKISTLDFIYEYPCILRPYVALILPTLHEMLKKNGKHIEKTNHFGLNSALGMIFKKGSKRFKNEISLQDIITIMSYLMTGKTNAIINMLCTSFLTLSKSTHDASKVNDFEARTSETEANIKKHNVNRKREDVEDTGETNEKVERDLCDDDAQKDNADMSQNNGDRENDTSITHDCKMGKEEGAHSTEFGISSRKMKTVFSDSNIEEMHKSIKKERSYKFIKDNVYMLDKKAINCTFGKKYDVKDLIEIEESLHHLFTYMYIEQLYLMCPNNTLFQLSNKESVEHKKNKLLSRSKTILCEEFLLKRRNSWDMTFFFPDFHCSLETDLDFRNILSGFRLYVSSKENSKMSLYCLAVDYISSTFLNIGANYSDAAFKHFTDTENVTFAKEPDEEEYVNGNKEEELKTADLNDICLTSFELIHSIYTNMKKNELKNQESTEDALLKREFQQEYSRSSSILEIQNSTNGWRGLFLNKSSKILTDEIVFALRQCSPVFTNNEWYRLYASRKQGTSFNRFISSFLYYPSSIVIVIKTSDHQILGGVCTTPLKDSHLFHGSPGDFLFSAYPIFRVLRTNGLGNNYVYLNSKNSFYPKGLGFGGKTECFRFFLSDEFKQSYCTQSDYTYEGGRLYFPQQKKKRNGVPKNDSSISKSSTVNGSNKRESEDHSSETTKEKMEDNRQECNNYSNNDHVMKGASSDECCNVGANAWNEDSDDEYEEDAFLSKLPIVEVEVWGCGDTKALEEQRIMLQNEETCKNERRSVDKSKIVQSDFDKQFLFPKMFAGKMEEMAPDT